jgi:hypothetical protein
MTVVDQEICLKFTALGLVFESTIIYTPAEEAVTSGPADNWYEGAPADIEFVDLSVDGKDASFLLDTQDMDVYVAILNAALKAVSN